MNYRLFPILLSAMIAATSYSAPLTPSQALSRTLDAKEFRKKGLDSGKMKLVHTATDLTSMSNCFYIFNQENGGYMILTADDRLPAVLGYSEKGTYNRDNVPPAMQWWLEGYREQISAYVNDESLKAPELSDDMNRFSFITPLLTTQWDQDAPYWDKTPQLNGVQCLTGCVATAMAQVMNYHEWPVKGKGENSYYWEEGKMDLSADFSNYTFDWDNMLDRYTEDASTAEKDAVANLMYACGISVKMSYSITASGAVSQRIANALINYFDYDKATRYVSRSYYSDDEWVSLIYNELKEGRPVAYGGNGSAGGHQFVCDGYSSDTKRFHFNWGWSGESDGYFMLNSLNPSSLGAGGGAGGFNNRQDAIIGVQKPTSENEYIPVIVAKGDFTTNYPYSPTTWSFRNGYFYTTDNRGYSITPGVKFVDPDGEERYFFSENMADLPMANPNTGYTSGDASFETYVDDSQLSIGEMYYVYPVFKYNGNIYPIRVPAYTSRYTTVIADYRNEHPLDVTYFRYTDVEAGGTCNMTFYIRNNTMESRGGNVSLEILDNELNRVDFIENIASIEDIGSGEIEILSFEVATGNLSDNLYYVSLIFDGDDKGADFPWVIGKRVKSISIPDNLIFTDDTPQTLPMTISPADATWQQCRWISLDPEVATVDSNGTVSPHKEGSTYIKVYATDGSDAEARTLVTVPATVGIGSLISDDEISDDENISVVRIDGTTAPAETISSLRNLEPGMYIVKSGNRTFKYIKH